MTPEVDNSRRHRDAWTYDDEADAVRIANDSEYGLGGSVWTAEGLAACVEHKSLARPA